MISVTLTETTSRTQLTAVITNFHAVRMTEALAIPLHKGKHIHLNVVVQTVRGRRTSAIYLSKLSVIEDAMQRRIPAAETGVAECARMSPVP